MASWEFAFEIDRNGETSLAQQIAHALTTEIQRGRLRPGDALPGSRSLAATLNVHRQTVVSALEELIAEGWLVTRPASGTFVADALPEIAPSRRARKASRFALPLLDAPHPELPRNVPAGTILMSGMRPDVRLLPADLLGRAYRRVQRLLGTQLLSYNHPAGHIRLRRELASMLSATRGVAADTGSILVTRGSQMGLALAALALIRPGDAVAVEHPGYRPAWEAFRMAGAEVLPVAVDEDGIDLRALQQLLAKRAIRAVYVTPHHQMPTTATLTGPRRLRLLQLATQHGFAIVEDDYDHEFHYSGRPVPPMASLDKDGVVIYVGTFSKVLAPGLRVGFVVAPPDLIERMTAWRSFIDLQGDSVLECAIAELLERGLIQRHVRKVRATYRHRLETLALLLRRQLGDFLTFDDPAGGTAIWVRTADARTMTRWARASAERGVAFDEGSAFTLDGAAIAGARIGFASLNDSEAKQAVKRLASAANAR
ncbi:MAG: PLP-dependent aminotransferase family protein [Acidobacteria bacterium]|nr:PLP-dependent aminotransferase family protein [Acidobacteriota bacterium]